MSPFENDFLRDVPRFLETARERAVVVAKSKNSGTVIQGAIGAFPKLIVALAVMGAVSVGATSVQTPTTGELHATPIRAKPTAEVAFEQYLWRLEVTNGGRFPTPHVQAARVVWERFRSLSAVIDPPQTAPTPEGQLSMVWDVGAHHLEVDVGADRKVAWFYTNRSTGQYEGKEGSLAEHLPRRLEDIVRGLRDQLA